MRGQKGDNISMYGDIEVQDDLSVINERLVPRDGVEPPTRGFSVPCSTY